MNLAERAAATDSVLARYRGKPFSWSGANCIRLARAQGVTMGHNLPPVPLFRTPLGAKRALRAQGVDSVEALLDRYFVRLPAPAFAWVGDLCVLPEEPGAGGLAAVCIADGQGNLLGWHEANPDGMSTIKFAAGDVRAAWRL